MSRTKIIKLLYEAKRLQECSFSEFSLVHSLENVILAFEEHMNLYHNLEETKNE